MAAAAASSSQRCSDVFLSFRGEDTRNNFTAYLDQELRTQRIDCFIDKEKIERGKAISPALVAATENSMFSIIVLSEDYAHLPGGAWRSWWRYWSANPIFYNVDPSDVRNHRGKLEKHWLNMKRISRRIWRGCRFGGMLSLKLPVYLVGIQEISNYVKLFTFWVFISDFKHCQFKYSYWFIYFFLMTQMV